PRHVRHHLTWRGGTLLHRHLGAPYRWHDVNGLIGKRAGSTQLFVSGAVCRHGAVNGIDENEGQDDRDDDDSDRDDEIEHGSLRFVETEPRVTNRMRWRIT